MAEIGAVPTLRSEEEGEPFGDLLGTGKRKGGGDGDDVERASLAAASASVSLDEDITGTALPVTVRHCDNMFFSPPAPPNQNET